MLTMFTTLVGKIGLAVIALCVMVLGAVSVAVAFEYPSVNSALGAFAIVSVASIAATVAVRAVVDHRPIVARLRVSWGIQPQR